MSEIPSHSAGPGPARKFWTTVLLHDEALFAVFRTAVACSGQRPQDATHEALRRFVEAADTGATASEETALPTYPVPPEPNLPHAKLWVTDRDLYARFKAAAARRSVTRTEAGRAAVRLYLAAHPPVKR